MFVFFRLSNWSKFLYKWRKYLIKKGFVERVSKIFLHQIFEGTESNSENIWFKCRGLSTTPDGVLCIVAQQ